MKNPEPIKKLNISLKKFMINRLKDANYFLIKLYNTANKEIEPEEKK